MVRTNTCTVHVHWYSGTTYAMWTHPHTNSIDNKPFGQLEAMAD